MSTPQTHPLILTAAGAVILASGVGVAHWLGWVGNAPAAPATQASAPAAQVTALPATPLPTLPPTLAPTPVPTPTAAPTPVPTRKPKPHHPKPTALPPATGGVVAPPTPVREVCSSCGRVASVRSVEHTGEATGGGAVVGGVVGGVVGHQIGKGRGNDVATVLGAIGGAVLGHQVEKQVKKTTSYEVSVVFDDGSERSFSYKEPPPFAAGERVRLRDGQLTTD
ncbi:Outer membrane lipoprotein SlyB [Andreprevotia lacus DSM 23236]|uniref:Outer membrane lipoprotein SlyB n=1 Tax=Andreprevotia lacus DSM 23236 TaxID=1121001 RepID=A0A1W1X357_9NEIS|nr:glycine zipper 2TM domain-containing protein [Andreprevotia lacus]SMC18158.1 Outer membrane lipoprotein SlyB [Andreprevotia lacus DSM 23236]